MLRMRAYLIRPQLNSGVRPIDTDRQGEQHATRRDMTYADP